MTLEQPTPRVSVIMIFLNGERFIDEAIQSVFAQSFDDWELLLVDDGSSDRSTLIARTYAERHPSRVRYLEHPGHENHGTGASRNLGIAHANADYVAFIDADDRWSVDQLREQVQLMDEHPRAGGVFGRTVYWYSWTGNEQDAEKEWTTELDGGTTEFADPVELLSFLLGNESLFFCLCSAMFRRSALVAAGGFDERFRDTYEDMALHARLMLTSPVLISDRIWGWYRRHEGSTWSSASRRERPEAANAIARAVDRAYERRFTVPSYETDPAYQRFLEVIERDLLTRGLATGPAWKTVQAELKPLRQRTRHRLAQLRPYAIGQVANWRQAQAPAKRARAVARRVVPAPARRRLRSALAGGEGGVILLYHRIAGVDIDPWAIAVRPDHFAEHLDVIRRMGSAMTLDDMINATQERTPTGAVAVTFDDGYVDNLDRALPILERAGVPATVFVVSGGGGHAGTFWWDELVTLVLCSGPLPDALTLEVGGAEESWPVNDRSAISPLELRRHRGWIAWEDDPPTERHELYLELWQTLQPLQPEARREALRQLRDQTSSRGDPSDGARAMTAEELQRMAGHPLITIGAHTVTHPQLSALGPDAQVDEIARSKDELEERLGQRITAFAYPFGGAEDYDRHSVEAVAAAGYRIACTTHPGAVRRRSELLELPRLYVQDWNGDEFERRLREARLA